MDSDYDRNPLLKPYDREAITFKANIRSGRAHAALFQSRMKGEEVMKGDEAHDAWIICLMHMKVRVTSVRRCDAILTELALKDFMEALENAIDNAVPRKELKELEKVYRWALKANWASITQEARSRFSELTF